MFKPPLLFYKREIRERILWNILAFLRRENTRVKNFVKDSGISQAET